jgi:hypothetical protein
VKAGVCQVWLLLQVGSGVAAAKMLETRLHQVLMRSGVPLDSHYDGKKYQRLLSDDSR